MKKILILLFSAFLIMINISCSNKQGNGKKQQKDFEPKLLLTSTQLEKYGFQAIDGIYFELFLLKKGFILANRKDCNIIRYKSPDDIRQYKAKGIGPGEFLHTTHIFRYDAHTIAIQDFRKRCVLLFDLDLNFKREIKINTGISSISSLKEEKRFIAFGFFSGNVFAFLDQDFKIKETFVEEIKKSRLPNVYPRMLNAGYFLNKSQFAFTQKHYTDKVCKIKIYNADTKKVESTLTWEQDRLPSKKDRMERKNMYFSIRIKECGGFYVALNMFVKMKDAPVIYDLIVFDKDGKIRYRNKNFPYTVILIDNSLKSRLYLMTDNEDIAYIELRELLNQ